jgi:hypothetical protein
MTDDFDDVADGSGLDWCRSVLGRLGWPIDSLSDEELVQALYARWFDQTSDRFDPMPAASPAAAQGIVATLACEGNLDALCWCEADIEGMPEPVDVGALPQLSRGPHEEREPGIAPRERRGSRRTRRSDLVRFAVPGGAGEAGGWLVDTSSEGMAFITEIHSAPRIGTAIQVACMGREQGVADMGAALVVRTELLSDSLGLVCARREGEDWGGTAT